MLLAALLDNFSGNSGAIPYIPTAVLWYDKLLYDKRDFYVKIKILITLNSELKQLWIDLVLITALGRLLQRVRNFAIFFFILT
jgi:hypothetical protein